MALVTIAEVRGFIETDLDDVALQLLIDEADEAVVSGYGFHPVAGVTATWETRGSTTYSLWLPRPALSISSITHRGTWGAGETEATVQSGNYRLEGGRRIVRLYSTIWSSHLLYTVTYTPVDDSTARKSIIIDLVRLAVQNRGNIRQENTGGYWAQYEPNGYEAARARALRRLRPFAPGSHLR